jgi:hypothetical protein
MLSRETVGSGCYNGECGAILFTHGQDGHSVRWREELHKVGVRGVIRAVEKVERH